MHRPGVCLGFQASAEPRLMKAAHACLVADVAAGRDAQRAPQATLSARLHVHCPQSAQKQHEHHGKKPTAQSLSRP